jgi:mono/diheme cytochrome c family protein
VSSRCWLGTLVIVIAVAVGACGGGRDKNAQSGSGRVIYATHCASCHGTSGGGTSAGPQLSGGKVVRDLPNVDDEITVVSNGRGLMPAAKIQLTPKQIQAVVRYTRTSL